MALVESKSKKKPYHMRHIYAAGPFFFFYVFSPQQQQYAQLYTLYNLMKNQLQ